MKLPRFLLGAVIAFWGWQTGLWLPGLVMAGIYEGAEFTPARWQIPERSLKQIVYLSTTATAIFMAVLLATNRTPRMIYLFMQYLPIIYFPLIASLAYAVSNQVKLTILFSSIPKGSTDRAVSLTYPYFGLCLVSASMTLHSGISFYLGMTVLISLALWSLRSPRFSPVVWLLLLALAWGLGMGGYIALSQLHSRIESQVSEWIAGYDPNSDDPLERTTAIGDIGTLKLSNRILFRVRPLDDQPIPPLLRRATYHRYLNGQWGLPQARFETVEAEEVDRWHFAEHRGGSHPLQFAMAFNQVGSLLSLPEGSFQVSELPAIAMEMNRLGTVRVEIPGGLTTYQVDYGDVGSIGEVVPGSEGKEFYGVRQEMPTPEDLEIPLREQSALNTIINQLDLRDRPTSEVLERLQQFFLEEFDYSLDLAVEGTAPTALGRFLLEDRAGHCEYFATATTLLLRQLGIPARYAIGYSVHEFSPREQWYVVRGRNAHAWTMVYVDGVWQPFDTTPPVWIALEDEAAPAYQALFDWLSWLAFQGQKVIVLLRTRLGIWIWLVSIPILGVIGYRFVREFSRVSSDTEISLQERDDRLGLDSEYYQIEAHLKQSELLPRVNEARDRWLTRVGEHLHSATAADELRYIHQLHIRYRFDPRGLTEAERTQLKTAVTKWLDNYSDHLGANSVPLKTKP